MSSVENESHSANTFYNKEAIEASNRFPLIESAIINSQFGILLPEMLCLEIAQFRGGNELYWDTVGEGVIIENDGLTVRPTIKGKTALGNKIFAPNTGKYTWFIKVDKIESNGCKYIGVVNTEDMAEDAVNQALYNGFASKRIVWDGSCKTVYNDIDTVNLTWSAKLYTRTAIDKTYVTGDIIGVHLDTDKREVYFSLNGETINVVSSYKKECILQAAIGFNYRSDNTEQYTILSYSWW